MERVRGHAYMRRKAILQSRVYKNGDNFPFLLKFCTIMSQKSSTFAAEISCVPAPTCIYTPETASTKRKNTKIGNGKRDRDI